MRRSGTFEPPPSDLHTVCCHRFCLRTENLTTRRRVVKWLFLHFTVYDYRTSGPECRGCFTTAGRGFPATAFRDLTYGLRGDETLHIRVISYDFGSLYPEQHNYRNSQWSGPRRL